MKNAVRVAAFMMAGLGALAGCSNQAASSSEAIQHAKTFLKTPQQQADYLVSRAQAFVKAEDYQEAIKTMQYVLLSVDTRSQAATDLLERANAKLAADVQAIVGEKKRTGSSTNVL